MANPPTKKPLPQIHGESKWFWEACARHELVLQRCASCGTIRWHPRGLCPECLSEATEYVRSTGRGSVYTFTVVHQNQAPGFRDELPYVLAYVELDEGVRILTNVVDSPVDEVRIGMPVEVVFEDVHETLSLPKFRKSKPSPGD